MGRSGYSEDAENVNLWRGAVRRAIQGKRGQMFLREMLEALDTLPGKRLIAEYLEADGEVCAIGSVGKRRGVDMKPLDPENHNDLAKIFDISRVMVAEIEFINDDDFFFSGNETPERRYTRVRNWVVRMLAGENP